MKRFLVILAILLSLFFVFDYIYFYNGDIYLPYHGEVQYSSKAKGEKLYIDRGNDFEVFDMKGVNLGLGKPGYFATETAITKDEYLRWFKHIQDMGANVIRTYTIANEDFYDAFYEYNINNPTPLYLIHGVWVNDYLINSSYSALDKEFYQPFFESCKSTVDVVHGRHKSRTFTQVHTETYDKDISKWVYGYILGVEWEDTLVAYTDNSFDPLPQYAGKYFYTENASNFEIFLAMVGDGVAAYETNKYGEQRVMAFSNWASTDPLLYPTNITHYFKKSSRIDVEHIKCRDSFLPGQFASYHIYPYYPDYYSFLDNHDENTYLQYLTDLNNHHSIPVVITEFGVPSSRGMAATEVGLGRNQGFMSETQQGEALVSMYQDIMKAGSAGAIAFIWQDEWFKRTWNTMQNVDLNSTPYWSDYQTNEQYFGLLSFDPGEEKSICYVDGDKSDWSETDFVTQQDGMKLSMKYDQKFIYFLVEDDGFDVRYNKLYIPIDTTSKSGSRKAENLNLQTSEDSDFIIEINGMENSRVWVQERYNTTEALFSNRVNNENIFSRIFPDRDSSQFNKILLLLQKDLYYEKPSPDSIASPNDEPLTFNEFDSKNLCHYSILQSYETGKLLYGNANPKADNFNSLADFCAGDGILEIKLPWELLNFADPCNMKIHDDYYECHGVEYLSINSMMVGVGDGQINIQMQPFELTKLGKNSKYHERLKESYYILQNCWAKKTD